MDITRVVSIIINSNNITHLISQANKLKLQMPKYVLIGLIVVIATFLIMNYSTKFKETTKKFSVSMGFFGPIILSHHPGFFSPSWYPAT